MPTILLIEDDRLIHQSLLLKLRGWGYNSILSAFDTTMAYALQMKHGADLLIVDIDLPGLYRNGVEMVEKLQEKGYEAAVIYLSGIQDANLLERARATNPQIILDKSISDKNLELNIQLACENKQAEVTAPAGLNDFVFVKKGKYHIPLPLADICYLESDEGTFLVTKSGGKHYNPLRLGRCLQQLGRQEKILRIHKSYAINTDYIEKVNKRGKLIHLKGSDEALKIGETYVKDVLRFLGI